MSKFDIFWLLFLTFMFIGSRVWGDVSDLVFWGFTLTINVIFLGFRYDRPRQ
jgi:hypothetical protein